MKKFLLSTTVAASLVFVGCTRHIYLPVESTSTRIDSIALRSMSSDSVIDRDTIRFDSCGDTVRITDIHWRWRTRIVRDTVNISSRQASQKSIPQPTSKSLGDTSLPIWQIILLVSAVLASITTLLTAVRKWISTLIP